MHEAMTHGTDRYSANVTHLARLVVVLVGLVTIKPTFSGIRFMDTAGVAAMIVHRFSIAPNDIPPLLTQCGSWIQAEGTRWNHWMQ
jgi:hypothetical protein